MLRLKIEYSDKHLQNLNLSLYFSHSNFYISLFFFFFEPLPSPTDYWENFNFENFDAFFEPLFKLLYSGEIVAFSTLFARDLGGLIILTLINPPVRFSSPTPTAPAALHRYFIVRFFSLPRKIWHWSFNTVVKSWKLRYIARNDRPRILLEQAIVSK